MDISLKDLFKKKELIINIGIILLCFIFSKNIYQSHLKRVNYIRSQIKEEKKRYAILQDLKSEEKKLEGYKASFAMKDISSLIEKVTALTSQFDVKISSFSPQEPKEEEFFGEISLELNFEGSYSQLKNFLDALENSWDSLRITRLYITRATDGLLEGKMLLKNIYLKE